MTTLNISKSKYCNAVQCPKMLWMHKNMKDKFDDSVMNEAILKQGNLVGDLAMGLLGEFKEVPYDSPEKMMNDTAELMKSDVSVIAEASFSFQGMFCSVDILKRTGKRDVQIYEVKSSTTVKDINLHDIAYQNYVLENLGFNVTKVFIVHIDNTYIRQGPIEIKKLFTIVDQTAQAKELYGDVKERIEFLKKYMKQSTEPELDINENCFSPYNCGYWGYCSRHLPEFSVFNVSTMFKTKKFEYYRNGIIDFQDVLYNAKLNHKQMIQVSTRVQDLPPHIEKEKIQSFLNTLYFPLYFLDFETYQLAIPPFDDISPYTKVPFQYSLHFANSKQGELFHKEFLGVPGQDPRRELAEKLTKDIPRDACVIAYNAGFEKGVIAKLAELFPDLAKDLMNIHENIKDIMTPFQKGHYYMKEMKGSYSIKCVLPALFPNERSLNYQNLSLIHDGGEASEIFPAMADMTEDEIKPLRKALLEYCKLDTFAMVKIWQKLMEV